MSAFYHSLRIIIYDKLFEEMEELAGDIEVDERYFGGVCKGERGHAAALVFRLLKCSGMVLTLPAPDTRLDTLIPIIAYKVKPDSITYTHKFLESNQGSTELAKGRHLSKYNPVLSIPN